MKSGNGGHAMITIGSGTPSTNTSCSPGRSSSASGSAPMIPPNATSATVLRPSWARISRRRYRPPWAVASASSSRGVRLTGSHAQLPPQLAHLAARDRHLGAVRHHEHGGAVQPRAHLRRRAAGSRRSRGGRARSRARPSAPRGPTAVLARGSALRCSPRARSRRAPVGRGSTSARAATCAAAQRSVRGTSRRRARPPARPEPRAAPRARSPRPAACAETGLTR